MSDQDQDQQSLYDPWATPDDLLMFPGSASTTAPILSGGLSTMASLYTSTSDILTSDVTAQPPSNDYNYSTVPSVGESYRSSPSPGMQTAPDGYPCSPTSPMFAATPNQFTTLNTFQFPDTCATPQASVSTTAEFSPVPDSPLHLENTRVDFKELESFVQSQLQEEAQPTNVGTLVKHEPESSDDDSSVYTPDPKPRKRRGGRPRDPVVYDGVPPLTVMKKERRKEQNRRAARKCREKKKAYTEQVMADYSRMQSENAHLTQTVAQLQKKLRVLQSTFKSHASQCSLLTSQLTSR